jgi:hypothetical protein
MDFELNESQSVVLDAVLSMIEPFRTLPTGARGYFEPAPDLDSQLAENGFFQIASFDDCGPLDAALLVYELARLPVLVEAAATALVAPQLGLEDLPRPIAIADDRHGSIRNLPGARTLILLEDGEACVASLDGAEITRNTSVLAYPYGRLVSPAALETRSLGAGSGEKLALWWRVAIAIESAALLQAALDATVDYVKQRTQFGKPLGAFQAIKHRLAASAQLVSGARWLALRAAESGDAGDAAVAAAYAQDNMRIVLNDLHQFTGAIGLTLEYPLHLWTYRLKALQGEFGGSRAQGEAASLSVFGALP